MVSKITILEPHFDGAQFGPASIGTETDSTGAEAATTDVPVTADAPDSEAPSGSAGGRRLLGAGALVLVAALALLAVRRLRQEASEGAETDIDAPEAIPIE